jgi:hypothetical protein
MNFDFSYKAFVTLEPSHTPKWEIVNIFDNKHEIHINS